jgi:AcrR family transcriptional regulator
MPKVVPEYKEDAKRRIIEAAMDVIAERGCDNMTFDDVAKKLGVSKGAIYWYFKRKEDLIAAVLDKFRTDIERTTFESYYNRPIDELFSTIFDRFALTDDRQRAIFFEMFALAARDSEIRHATREYYNGLVATFEEAIKKEKKQHFIQTQADAHQLALLLAALYSGLQNYELVWMYQNEIRNLWTEGVKIILRPTYTGTYGEGKKD